MVRLLASFAAKACKTAKGNVIFCKERQTFTWLALANSVGLIFGLPCVAEHLYVGQYQVKPNHICVKFCAFVVRHIPCRSYSLQHLVFCVNFADILCLLSRKSFWTSSLTMIWCDLRRRWKNWSSCGGTIQLGSSVAWRNSNFSFGDRTAVVSTLPIQHVQSLWILVNLH